MTADNMTFVILGTLGTIIQITALVIAGWYLREGQKENTVRIEDNTRVTEEIGMEVNSRVVKFIADHNAKLGVFEDRLDVLEAQFRTIQGRIG